jgi:hypothetical protein
MAGLVRPSIRRELKRVDEGHHVPDGRYMSILLADNGHYSPEVFYDAGVIELHKRFVDTAKKVGASDDARDIEAAIIRVAARKDRCLKQNPQPRNRDKEDSQ